MNVTESCLVLSCLVLSVPFRFGCQVCAIEQERCFALYFLSCLCMARIVFSIIARFLSIVPWLSLYFLQGLLDVLH